MRSTNQLNAYRQAVARQTTRQRECGTAGESDHEGEKHPVDVSGQFFPGDFGREPLLDRERRYCHGRTNQQVVVIKEARHAVEERIAVARRSNESQPAGHLPSAPSARTRTEGCCPYRRL